MSKSTRGPQHGHDGPFMMHLERVCRLIEMGAEMTIEFNPSSDLPAMLGGIMEHVRLKIHEDGAVSLHADHNTVGYSLTGLTLASYNRLWRCWQNGAPSEARQRAVKWG